MDEKYIQKVTENEQRSKSNSHRLDNVEERTELLHEMNTNIMLIAQESKGTTQKVNKIEKDIDEIKQKPSKRFDLVIAAAITAIVTVTITLLINNFLG